MTSSIVKDLRLKTLVLLLVGSGLVGFPGSFPEPALYAQTAPGRPAASQNRGRQNQDAGEDVIRITNVTVPVIVTDQDDRFISKLTKDDFEIYENKKKQKIESFEDKTDLPLFVAILMDTSASVKPKLKFQKEATISFLQTIIRRRKDQALFVTFDSTVQLRQDFTDDTNLLAKAIMEVKAAEIRPSTMPCIAFVKRKCTTSRRPAKLSSSLPTGPTPPANTPWRRPLKSPSGTRC